MKRIILPIFFFLTMTIYIYTSQNDPDSNGNDMRFIKDIDANLVTALSDGIVPNYVAFGASTTIGSIHHFRGETTTRSQYNYPDYVGKALNLNVINLGQGTTGFIARNKGETSNFMDSIYANDIYLKDASLVSIVFGYGNDFSAGLPIGEYDDFYPYDEEGYHPAGADGVTEMLAKGATLMGCLNWCIKYLHENYPKAQLVIIFSAPSGNKDRTITVMDNPEGGSYGTAPRKLQFTNPYSESGSTQANKGILEISTELNKLKEAINIPIIDTFFYEGIPFSWYSTYAKNKSGEYALFSTTGDESDPSTWTWNSHPNDDGYLMYGRYIAGLIIRQFKH